MERKEISRMMYEYRRDTHAKTLRQSSRGRSSFDYPHRNYDYSTDDENDFEYQQDLNMAR
jgi:hypothetical protein